MTFVKGQSGNPAGRPLGARNRKTLLLDGMLEDESVEMVQRLIEQAHAGDAAALRVCLDRILPRGQDRPVAAPRPLRRPQPLQQALLLGLGPEGHGRAAELAQHLAEPVVGPAQAVLGLKPKAKSRWL